MLKKIRHIILDTTKQWKGITLMYIIQFTCSFFVATLAYDQIDISIGNSLELDRLAQGFDRSVFSDMINEFPTIVKNIQFRFLWVLLLFIIVSVFFHAGLLGNIHNRNFSLYLFFKNGLNNFFQCLLVVLISIIKILITLILIWLPFLKWADNPLEVFHSEKTFIFSILGLIIISVLAIITIWSWSVISRYLVTGGGQVVHSMRKAWKTVKANFLKSIFIGIGLLSLHFILVSIYTLIVDDWGADAWIYILGLIGIQQTFAFVRVWMRALGYVTLHKVVVQEDGL